MKVETNFIDKIQKLIRHRRYLCSASDSNVKIIWELLPLASSAIGFHSRCSLCDWKRIKWHFCQALSCSCLLMDALMSKGHFVPTGVFSLSFVYCPIYYEFIKHFYLAFFKHKIASISLSHWFWKCGHQTSSIRSLWELIGNANSQPSTQTYWIRNTVICILGSPPGDSDACSSFHCFKYSHITYTTNKSNAY